MVIKKINLNNLRNEEHFQFQTDFNELVKKKGVANLNIETAYAVFLSMYGSESMALDKIRKNALSDDLVVADQLRDETFGGMTDAMNSALRHFNPDVRRAAKRVKVVFDQHGNLAIKPYDQETTAINQMLKELNEHYAADMATIGISDWAAHLKSNNDDFVKLKTQRYSEESSKTHLQMKPERSKLDKAYIDVTKRIDALMLVDGNALLEDFINELNQRIDSYALLLAQRKGRNNGDEGNV